MDTEFPQIDEQSDGFKALCAIFTKHDVQNYFLPCLLHRHRTISERQILLGNSIAELPGFWTEPTAIHDIDLQNVHGHFFSINTISEGDTRYTSFLPSEFRVGPPVDFGHIDNNFYKEVSEYLLEMGWENTFGLEVKEQNKKMIEFPFDVGSLLLKEDRVKAEVGERFESQETSWTISVKGGLVCTTGETRCFVYPTGHVRMRDTKIKGWLDALKILRDDSVLVY